jgi:hypothetical protein
LGINHALYPKLPLAQDANNLIKSHRVILGITAVCFKAVFDNLDFFLGEERSASLVNFVREIHDDEISDYG